VAASPRRRAVRGCSRVWRVLGRGRHPLFLVPLDWLSLLTADRDRIEIA
jgi:hypothetical protein